MARNRLPAFLAGAYAVLGLLSVVPVLTGDDPMSGIFAVLLGSPWTQMLSSALAAAGAPSPSTATGLALAGIGIAVNAAILYLLSRWLARARAPR